MKPSLISYILIYTGEAPRHIKILKIGDGYVITVSVIKDHEMIASICMHRVDLVLKTCIENSLMVVLL